MEVTKSVAFEAAHRLPLVPVGHKCGRLHGHSYRVELTVSGPVGADGFVVDYQDIADAWQPLHDLLDHYYLNDVPGLDNPTTEVLAVWIWERMKPPLPGLSRVAIQETCTERCVYRGQE